MFKLFLQIRRRNVKKSFNPYMEYRIVLKDGMWEKVRLLKGWKSDAEAARALNLTRSYVSMITKAKVGCTATFITRLAASLGSAEGKWCELFKMIPKGDFPTNHPKFNQLKFDGEMPYERFSSAAELRKKDYALEKSRETNIV